MGECQAISYMLQLPKRRGRRFALLGLSVFWVVAGVNHFVSPDFYVPMMPPYLPGHLGLVYLSGVFEILGGILVLVPRVRAMAGWGLVALLLAIFPANIHMVLSPELFPDMSTGALYGRLPFQAVFLAWAYWATRPEVAESAEQSELTVVMGLIEELSEPAGAGN